MCPLQANTNLNTMNKERFLLLSSEMEKMHENLGPIFRQATSHYVLSKVGVMKKTKINPFLHVEIYSISYIPCLMKI